MYEIQLFIIFIKRIINVPKIYSLLYIIRDYGSVLAHYILDVHYLFHNPTYFTFIRENFLFYIKVHACIKHAKRIKMLWSRSSDDAESVELLGSGYHEA